MAYAMSFIARMRDTKYLEFAYASECSGKEFT